MKKFAQMFLHRVNRGPPVPPLSPLLPPSRVPFLPPPTLPVFMGSPLQRSIGQAYGGMDSIEIKEGEDIVDTLRSYVQRRMNAKMSFISLGSPVVSSFEDVNGNFKSLTGIFKIERVIGFYLNGAFDVLATFTTGDGATFSGSVQHLVAGKRFSMVGERLVESNFINNYNTSMVFGQCLQGKKADPTDTTKPMFSFEFLSYLDLASNSPTTMMV